LILQKLELTLPAFYALCAAFGLFNLWAISSTIVVEQFPTELRATASTSNYNCARGLVILMNVLLLYLKPLGLENALMIIALTISVLGLLSVWRLPESYGRTLDEC
jgi:hypothetical protein